MRNEIMPVAGAVVLVLGYIAGSLLLGVNLMVAGVAALALLLAVFAGWAALTLYHERDTDLPHAVMRADEARHTDPAMGNWLGILTAQRPTEAEQGLKDDFSALARRAKRLLRRKGGES